MCAFLEFKTTGLDWLTVLLASAGILLWHLGLFAATAKR